MVRASIRVAPGKKGAAPEETKKDGSSAVLLKKKDGGEDVALEDFKIKKVLDKGSFGKVFLVVHKTTGA